MAKDWPVTAFSLRTPLTSLQIAPQYCIHPSTDWFYPPTPDHSAHKTRGWEVQEGQRSVCWWYSEGLGFQGAILPLLVSPVARCFCIWCIHSALVSVSLCLFLQLCPGSQWGTDLEEDPLGQKWCVVGFRHASLFPKWPTNLLSTNCKDGRNLTNSASR